MATGDGLMAFQARSCNCIYGPGDPRCCMNRQSWNDCVGFFYPYQPIYSGPPAIGPFTVMVEYEFTGQGEPPRYPEFQDEEPRC